MQEKSRKCLKNVFYQQRFLGEEIKVAGAGSHYASSRDVEDCSPNIAENLLRVFNIRWKRKKKEKPQPQRKTRENFIARKSATE